MIRTRFTLTPRRPYSLTLTAARFGRFEDGVDRVDEGRYRRLWFVEGRPLLVSVTQQGPPSRARLSVELAGPGARRRAARDGATRLVERSLGTTQEVSGFYRDFRDDALLGALIGRFRGLRVAGWPTLWETLLTAILSQQVNLVLAHSIRCDLARAFGRRARFGSETYVAFPTAERVAAESETTLRRFRLSSAKSRAIAGLARAFRDGRLAESDLVTLDDETVVERLTAFRGIGRWTAEIAMLRGLGRLDTFPAADLGVVKHLAQGLLGRRRKASEQQMRRYAERWRPHRGLALVYAYAELARIQSSS